MKSESDYPKLPPAPSIPMLVSEQAEIARERDMLYVELAECKAKLKHLRAWMTNHGLVIPEPGE